MLTWLHFSAQERDSYEEDSHSWLGCQMNNLYIWFYEAEIDCVW